MTSHRLQQQLLALSLPVGWLLTPITASGQSTWTGATSNAWNVAANWTPGIPAEGANIIISDTTSNGLTLDTSHSVGSITIGTNGTRTSGFTFQTNTANTLTLNNGVTANGNFTGVGPTFRGNYTISQDQTFTIAGSLGSVTSDAGMFLRGPNDTAATVPSGALTLNGDIIKEGSGQLSVLGMNVTGAGDFIINAGALKLNAGGNQALVMGGTGNITMNSGTTLMFSRNSGTFGAFTRPILMGDFTSLVFGGGNDNSEISSPFAFNGTSASVTVNRSFTLSGALTGAATVSRAGDATKSLTLSGDTSGYTGIFSNTAGTLNIAGDFGGDLQVSAGTATAGGAVSGAATLSAGSLTLNGPVGGNLDLFGGTAAANGPVGGNLTASVGVNLSGEPEVAGNVQLDSMNLSIVGATPESLHASTDLTLIGTNSVILTGGTPTGTPFTVVSYDGFLTGDETNFALPGGASAYRGHAFAHDTVGKAITLEVDAGSVTWTGAASAVWDVNTSPNWTGTSDKFFQLDTVVFPDVASNKFISLPANVSPGSITFENNIGSDYSIASPAGAGFITGGASITKNGTGVTVLGGANGQNFTGPITVNAGVLRMGTRDAFGRSSGITVAGGAQVDIGGQTPGAVSTGGYTYTIEGTGPAPANTGAIVNTLAAVQSNAGIKNLILSGDATIGGTGRIDIGFANTAGFGTITGNGHTLTITNTDGVGFRGDASATPIDIVASGGNIWAENTDNGFGGATGTVTVNSGAKAGTFGTRTVETPVTLNAGGTLHNQGGGTGTWTGAITLAGEGAAIEAEGQQVVLAGSLVESGGSRPLVKTGNNRLVITGTASNTGTTEINNGFVQIGDGGSTGTINGQQINLNSATSGLIINRSDDITFSNVITGSGPAANASNPGAVTKLGTGTLTLTAANTYTGLTRFDQGTVAIGSDETVFGIGGLLDFRGIVLRSSDATNRTIANPVSYSEDTVLGSPGTGNLLFTGDTMAGGASKAFDIQNAVTEFSGVISGTGAGTTLTKTGPGTLIFSNDNTYTQTTTISAGVLQVGNGGGTGSLGLSDVINNASLVIDRTAAVGFTTFDFNNIVSGTGDLTYTGPDTINVNGNNTYTGDTFLMDGVFSMAFPCFADGSTIHIADGATLDLFHGQTDVVAQVVIGTDPPLAAGIYGAVGSGAPNEIPEITGDGFLEVSGASGSPYEDWASDKGLTPPDDDPAADPDNDGIPNLDEYALNSEPLSGATGGKIVVKVATVGGEQVLTLTLPVRDGVGTFGGSPGLTASGDGATYTVEAGDDLAAWDLTVAEVTGPDADAIQTDLPDLDEGWTYRTFRSPGTVNGDAKEFIRARVEE